MLFKDVDDGMEEVASSTNFCLFSFRVFRFCYFSGCYLGEPSYCYYWNYEGYKFYYYYYDIFFSSGEILTSRIWLFERLLYNKGVADFKSLDLLLPSRYEF